MMNIRARIDEITSSLMQAIKFLKKDGTVIGISGGIDSAVCLKLLEGCLPREKILPLILPERDSNPQSIKRLVMGLQTSCPY